MVICSHSLCVPFSTQTYYSDIEPCWPNAEMATKKIKTKDFANFTFLTLPIHTQRFIKYGMFSYHHNKNWSQYVWKMYLCTFLGIIWEVRLEKKTFHENFFDLQNEIL